VWTFLRSFLIQGSWNFHTMLGSGFAFAMLPALRRLFGSDPEEMDASVARHLEHFNSHPYMASVALGAALKLEAEGADPDMIRRFKVAVRGPLGSLGDALVWATWLPTVGIITLAIYWIGAPGWVSAAFFLVVYNIGHIGLRVWGFRVGLADGRDVARRLGVTDLGRLTSHLQSVLGLALGVLVGAGIAGHSGLVQAGPLWVGAAAGAFLAGLLVGHRAWRPAAMASVAAVGLVAVVGVLG